MRPRARVVIGEVAKRSNAADCKSVALAASKVRILPSPSLDSPLRGSLVTGRVTDAVEAPGGERAWREVSGLARRSGEAGEAARAAKAGVTQW